MIKLTTNWIYLEDGDKEALSLLLEKDFNDIVMVSRKQLITCLATAEMISKGSSLSVASMLDRLIDEADKAGITGL